MVYLGCEADTAPPETERPTMSTTPAPAALERYRIVGTREAVINIPGEGARAAGSCDNCGTGIRYVVVIENVDTGERMNVGRDCAMRVGLTKAELREHYASLYAAERAELAAKRAEADAALAAQHGEHGTAERLTSGCLCDPCVAAAPHGHWLRFRRHENPCSCDLCIAGFIAFADQHPDWQITIHERRTLVDLATGRPARARIVNGAYGPVWCVTNEDGHAIAWVTPSPKRRATIARKGYTEAMVPTLVDRIENRDGTRWYKPLAIMAWPTHDTYGEPLPA